MPAGCRAKCAGSRLGDGFLPFGLQLLEVARQNLLLLFPVPAEADGVRAEGEVLAVYVAGGRDDLAPGIERLFSYPMASSKDARSPVSL